MLRGLGLSGLGLGAFGMCCLSALAVLIIDSCLGVFGSGGLA